MNQIREVLRNRWFAWQEARAILEKTPVAELDLDEDVESVRLFEISSHSRNWELMRSTVRR